MKDRLLLLSKKYGRSIKLSAQYKKLSLIIFLVGIAIIPSFTLIIPLLLGVEISPVFIIAISFVPVAAGAIWAILMGVFFFYLVRSLLLQYEIDKITKSKNV